MRIVFISNFLNHHQTPLCREFYELLGENFKFISTEKVPEERVKLGYLNDFKDIPYLIETYNNEISSEVKNIIDEADIAIIGSAPLMYVKKRIRENKVVFYYSERLFKEGALNHPGDIMRGILKYTRYRRKRVYTLCASAYTSVDCRRILFGKKKLFKWGYFVDASGKSLSEIKEKKKKEVLKLLWVGRFIHWKHPEHFIHVCKRLDQEGYEFEAKMVGTGELWEESKAIICENHLMDKIELVGSVPCQQVRRYMEEADIFLFTSSRLEGWGAVLNESMASGCAVVACEQIGAVPYLIRNEENGFTYEENDVEDLYIKTKALLETPYIRNKFSENAFETINEQWNPRTAVERFYEISSEIISGGKVEYFKGGPMSIG